MKTYLTLLFCFLRLSIFSQDFYVVNNVTTLKSVNIQDLSVTNLFDLNVGLSDLAFSPDGRLFGITASGQIIEIDLENQTTNEVISLDGLGDFTALVANTDNELVAGTFSSGLVFRYSLSTGEISSEATEILTPGDFTYHRGSLVYPSIDNQYIRALNGIDLVDIGCSYPNIFAMVNIFESCETDGLYAINQFGEVYLYNTDDGTNELIGSIGGIGSGLIFGAASPTEFLASSCNQTEFNKLDCTLSNTFSKEYFEISLFPNPTSKTITISGINNLSAIQFIIFDALGQKVKEGQLEEEKIDVSSLGSGLYRLFLKKDDQISQMPTNFIKY